MLLVLGAEAAVERASLVRLDAVPIRDLARQAVLHLVVERDVGTDEVLADPMRWASLAKIDAALLGDDLGRHQREALGAEALGHAQERVIAQEHQRSLRGRSNQPRPRMTRPAARNEKIRMNGSLLGPPPGPCVSKSEVKQV